jgi:outer membrane immunogenic protein
MGLKARYVLLSTVSALALSGVASAADLPVKAPPPVAAAIFSWTGFYVGAHGGVAWLRHEQTITGPGISTCNFPTPLGTCRVNDTGAVFGGQVGYNWQAAPNWLIGIEADGSWTGLKETKRFPIGGGGAFHIANDKIDWLASLRGRVGLVAGQTLFYATGGVAFANFNAGWSFTSGSARAQADKTTAGWVAGGGIEHAFSRNWSARAEFLHYGLGNKSITSTTGGTYTTAFRHDVSVVRLGINFRP